MTRNVIIKDTHRGLWYEDGVLKRELGAGFHRVPNHVNFGFYRTPLVEIQVVDVRERDLTIKGQEILTADKVALRVSIVVQFKVIDPKAALHAVESYEDRLYSDVQLAARRSLATMDLETILTNRNQLSEDIMTDVREAAAGYGVAILRADVKDLVFPGDIQSVMNRVLAAQRASEAQLVEARTKAEVQRIDATARAQNQRLEAETHAAGRRQEAEAEAEALAIRTTAEARAAEVQAAQAQAYDASPALMRLRELEALKALAQVATAQIYIGFDKHLGTLDKALGGPEPRAGLKP
jgi:regulator of protease activity HflC (stomatin/prohibitin superfamily)